MDTEWESDFFTSRHVHNRKSRHAAQSGSKGGSGFDVKRIYGTYELKCSEAERMKPSYGESQGQKRRQKKKDVSGSRLEIFRRTDDGDGLLGELVFLGVLNATVILAASRKKLRRISETTSSLVEPSLRPDPTRGLLVDEPACGLSSQDELPPVDVESEEDSKPIDREAKQRERFEKFEKNSFRQPKFWLWWEGRVLADPTQISSLEADAPQSGMGYIVFSGNRCKDLKGTLNCGSLGWREVAFRGWKTVEMSERDV